MPLPRVQPIAPTWRKEPFDDPDWLFEFKYDGFRALCYLEQRRNRLISRNGNIMTRFDELAERVAGVLDVDDAILDGEIIAVDETGRPQFYDLLLRGTRSSRYVAFDLLWLNGVDLRPLPLSAPAGAAGRPAEGISDRVRGAVGRRQGMRAVRVDVHQRPRRHRREALRRCLRSARQVAEDQEPRLHSKRGQRGLVRTVE